MARAAVHGRMRAVVLAALGMLACAPAGALGCEPPAGRLVSVEGVVEVRAAGTDAWQRAAAARPLCTGDTMAVRERSRAAVALANDVLLRLDQGSILTLGAVAADQASELGLLQGAVHVLSRLRRRFGVVTPYMNAMVEGTEFTVAVGSDRTRITVTEGIVQAENRAGRQLLTAGTAADATLGRAPVALQVRPLDAVQWALYYPQVVHPGDATVAALAPAARQAVQLAMDGRYTEALAAWPDAAADRLRAARAGWLLGVGRLDEAEALLAEPDSASARADDPTGALVLAVRAVVQVVRNQPAEALATARIAAARAPDAAAPLLASSYALQALRDPEAALEAVRRAVEREPDHPLAWARQAELQLSAGDWRAGERSAERALEIAPRTPRVRALLGFAQLLRGQDATARLTFAAAQAEAPADPLGHLGAALALLRVGALAAARHEMEIAAILDPSDAELRALLGRTYLAEGRGQAAAAELDVARSLDPRSPTAWFYEALRKQRANRPVEAAADYERAIALNDQRAVLRSGTLLDADRAARTAALAGAWRDLGFDAALLSTARAALLDDPQSEAAHRLLAEAYAVTPRLEAARVSELLQAQLRQSPRAEPVAPQELQPGLPVLNGPRAFALHETSALFDETRGGLRLGAMGGNRGLLGSAALGWRNTAAGQFSFGHFHYQAEGFRPGADIRLDVNNVLWQAALTPDLGVQAELRSWRGEGIDATQRLLPESATPQRQRDLATDALRLGLRYAPSPASELIASTIWSRRDSTSQDVSPIGPGRLVSTGVLHRDARLGELLYASRQGSARWTLGLSAYRDDAEGTLTVVPPPPLPRPPVTPLSPTTTHNLVFTYGAFDPVARVSLLWGLSHDRYDSGPIAVHRTSPKLGVVWRLANGLSLRAAAFSTVKGSAGKEQTVEPTQFAGFNQLFDDPSGTRSRRVALGLDHHPAGPARWGMELSRRRLVVPILGASPILGCGGPVCELQWTETLHRLYVDARLGTRWAASASLDYESQTLDSAAGSVNLPIDIRTWQLPLRLAHFRPGGWSAYGEVRGVRQHAAASSFATGARVEGSEQFWLANVGLRYRLAGGLAAIRLDVNNLFDRDFRFQYLFVSDNPRVPLFRPGRTVMARVEIRF